jgi:hypothetical protein
VLSSGGHQKSVRNLPLFNIITILPGPRAMGVLVFPCNLRHPGAMGVRSHVRSHVRLVSPEKVSAPNSGFRLKARNANSVRNDVRAWVFIHFGYPFRQNRLYNTWERLFCLCLLLLPTRPSFPLLIASYIPKDRFPRGFRIALRVSEGFPSVSSLGPRGSEGFSNAFHLDAKCGS